MEKKTNLDELVDEAGKESFPASDSPAWTRGIDKNNHQQNEDEHPERNPGVGQNSKIDDKD